MKRALMLSLLLLATLSSPTFAGSATKTFYSPTYGGLPVDFCVYWSKNCGKPAADRYCKGRSLEGAVKYTKKASFQTKLQGSGQVCTGPHCASFHSITCYEYGL